MWIFYDSVEAQTRLIYKWKLIYVLIVSLFNFIHGSHRYSIQQIVKLKLCHAFVISVVL